MIDSERPHRSTTEFFICFTSRLSSSSSMKISSKSILSPARTRETSPIPLSSSLSRRLRNNGSLKGGQASPAMFPSNTNSKKRGFENPEPSSPKVTCIGQVRVKTKKHGNKIRARSKRRSGGEVSFRKVEQFNTQNNNVDVNSNQDFNLGHLGTTNGNNNVLLHQHHHQQQQGQDCLPQRNQRWVHFPVTICEAFSCFLPCSWSSCTANNNQNDDDKKEKTLGGNGYGTSCGGAVSERWLVAVQEAVEEERKGREFGLVAGEEDVDDDDEECPRQRRHVFDDIEIDITNCNNEEEEARVSICVPPKNALLLMRCRSDPVKMASLATRFGEPLMPQQEEEEVDGEEVRVEETVIEEIEDAGNGFEHKMEEYEEKIEVCAKINQNLEASVLITESSSDLQIEDEKQEVNPKMEEITTGCNEEDADIGNEVETDVAITELVAIISPEDPVDGEMAEECIEEIQNSISNEEPESEAEEEDDMDEGNENESASLEQNQDEYIAETEAVAEEESSIGATMEEETQIYERSETMEPELDPASNTQQKTTAELPDCLLLMMCEPKLSMEVSKETWVNSTDFIRSLPERPPVNSNKPTVKAETRNVINTESIKPPRRSIGSRPPAKKVQQLQPHRSSCSYPAAPPSMAALKNGSPKATAVGDQTVVNGKGSYDSFVLSRCKSEPRRSAAKLAPDACFWKNRKLEPHMPPATLGVSAAGVGF